MNRNWLFTAALSLTFTAVPSFTRADTDIKYRDLPEGAKKKVESERQDLAVKKVTLIEHDGHKWYRITLDKKGPEDTVLRVSPEGELLGADVERDVRANAPTARATPAAVRAAEATDGNLVNYRRLPRFRQKRHRLRSPQGHSGAVCDVIPNRGGIAWGGRCASLYAFPARIPRRATLADDVLGREIRGSPGVEVR